MYNIIIIIIAGLVSTAVMCGFLELVTKSKLANADMIRAIGSMFTSSYENALKPGLIIQFSFGVVFAFIYFGVLSFFSAGNPAIAIVGGIVIGFFHGMVVGLSIVISVAEHHPLERFREAGFTVAAAHLFGHMVYGLMIGIIFAITGVRILVTSVG